MGGNPMVCDHVVRMAQQFTRGVEVPLTVELPRAPPRDPGPLRTLESSHKVLEVYLRLSYRFPRVFIEHERAHLVRQRCREMINTSLQLQAMRVDRRYDDDRMDQMSASHQIKRRGRRKGSGMPGGRAPHRTTRRRAW